MTTWTPRPASAFRVHRHRGDERLAFARLHLGDLALVQDHAADQLHVERPHFEGAQGGLPHHGEGLLEELVERGRPGGLQVLFVDAFESFRQPGPELVSLGAEGVVAQGVDRGLELVDSEHAGHQLLDVPLVLRAEDLGQDAVDHI